MGYDARGYVNARDGGDAYREWLKDDAARKERTRRRSWALRHAEEYGIDEEWIEDHYGETEAERFLRESRGLGSQAPFDPASL